MKTQLPKPKKVVLAYSGGLDTSIIIPWLKENYQCEVIAMIGDVGQQEDLQAARKKALATGASTAYVEDLREEFVRDYIWPTLRAGAVYEHTYLLGTSMARPILGKRQAELALQLGADGLSHGCTGKGNDQFRIEFAIRALIPNAVIHAPIREKNLTRSWEIEYAQKKNIPVQASIAKIWSIDENLWGRSIEGGRLEEPDFSPPEEIFQWTKSLSAALAEPSEVEIEFKEGIPVALNGKPLSPANLVAVANTIAGAHGVGRVDIMEDRMLGLKVRENYECPGAVLLLKAHAALEALVMTQQEQRFKKLVDLEWAQLAYQGLWFDPLKEDLEAFIGNTQKRVAGKVRLRLFKGGMQVIGRSSPWALYSEELVSFDTKNFDQRESTGMCKNFGLQSRLYLQLKQAMQNNG